MGKTRLEELFEELYASSKQHDSWQRYAMIVELRALMKQPKRRGSDQLERSLKDEELFETEVATEPIETKHGTVKREANAEVISAIVKKEQMPQIQVPSSKLEHGLQIHNASPIVCEDSQYVVGCDELCDHQKILQVSYVKEVEELPPKSTSGDGEHVAHQLFDQKPVRVTHKEKHMKHLKAWKFKFKSTSKRSRLMDDKFSFGDATVLLNKDPQETIWDCVKKEFKETMAGCGKKRADRFELVDEKESRPEVVDMNQTFLYHQIGHGVDILLVPKLLVHDKEGAVLPQRSKSLKISDCSDRSSRANRVWKPGGLLCVPNKKFEAELEICYKRDRVLKCYFLSEIPFVEFIEFKACKKELSVAGLRQRSLASMTFELRNVEDGVKQDTNRFSGDVGAKILMAFEGLHLLQVMRNTKLKFAKQWMFKFRKKKIDQQLGCDLMVTYLDNQTTWTSRFDEEDQRNLQSRTENSLSRREISTFICQAEALLFESKEPAISANQEHSSSSLRANQIWDPGGKFLYI